MAVKIPFDELCSENGATYSLKSLFIRNVTKRGMEQASHYCKSNVEIAKYNLTRTQFLSQIGLHFSSGFQDHLCSLSSYWTRFWPLGRHLKKMTKSTAFTYLDHTLAE